MKLLRTSALTFLTASFFMVPLASSAAALSMPQINSILSLLRAFNVDAAVLVGVEQTLGAASGAPSIPSTPDPVPATPPSSAYVPPSVMGSPYPSSSIGYDISFNTKNYPTTAFGFAVIGVNAGKSFTHNQRLASEFSWAHFASAAAPTLYLNVNAPYGSTASAATMSAPKTCDTLFGATTTSAATGGSYPEPTVCGSYNYGYNAAKDAYQYATNDAKVSAKLWWLDIEEENSWSTDVAVNDAVIQGTIDYLNSQGIRVGIYSVPYMWRKIAGDGFTPTESIGNSSLPVPTWFPIGINNLTGAINACRTKPSFIPGSPVWVIQYVADSVAIDQNIAC